MLIFKRINEHRKFEKDKFLAYLIKNKLPKTISADDWIFLFKNEEYGFIWKYLLENKEEKFYNFLVATKIFIKYYKFYDNETSVEEELYEGKGVYEISYLRIKTLEVCFKNHFNELIKKDIDILDSETMWTTFGLDTLYSVNLDHINFSKILEKKRKIESRKLFKIKITIHLIVATLEKLGDLYFYTSLPTSEKNSKSFPLELKMSIDFTKGYLICCSPGLVSMLKKFKYERKLPKRLPVQIFPLKKKMTFEESLYNSNFSEPIWMNESNIAQTFVVDGFNYKKDSTAVLHKNLDKNFVSIRVARVLILEKSGIITSGPGFDDFELTPNLDGSAYARNKSIYVKDGIVYRRNGRVYNWKLYKKTVNMKPYLSVLNFLNSIELTYDRELFNRFKQILNEHTDVSTKICSKHSLKNHILQIQNTKESRLLEHSFTEDTKKMTSLISSAATLELIDTQLQYYKSFFLDHRLDTRVRIYCYPWPINYQLHHIVRCALLFKNKPKLDKVWELFLNHKLVKKYIKDIDVIFDFNKSSQIEQLINNFFTKKKILSENITEDRLKKECVYQLMIKIAPSRIKNLNEKVEFSLSVVDDFVKDDMVKKWKYWSTHLGFSEKKLPYMLTFQQNLRNILLNDFSGIFWSDASNNAVQLISIRTSIRNTELLKLINVYNNDTHHSNIYEFMAEEIKKKSHKSLLQSSTKKNPIKIGDILTRDDVNSLQDIDINKYLLMPSCYGMGSVKYRENLDSMLQKDERREVWNLLSDDQKHVVSDYFWNTAIKVLKTKGFDMDLYKNYCKEFWKNTDYTSFIWKNDLGLPIAPVSFIESDRAELRKKEESLKLKIKETSDLKLLDALYKSHNSIKERLKQNDKRHYKRYMIETSHHKIFSRIYFIELYELCERNTRQSLVPNTIHAYDACVMHVAVQVCKKLGIEVLVIHDSIGCHLLMIPIVKAVFKLSNMLIIELNNKKPVFPLPYGPNLSQEELDDFFSKLLDSKNFFS